VAVVAHLDFESRSTVDLRKTGASVYAKDPTTDIMVLGYAFGENMPNYWVPNWGILGLCDSLDLVLEHVASGGECVAHNAAFELAIWNNVGVKKYGWPKLKPEQMTCTMVLSYAMALPGALGDVAPALGIDTQKDMKGHRVMMQLCKPRKIHKDGTVVWWDDLDKLKQLIAYCMQDVEVERELHKRLVPLKESEKKLWLLDQTINQRGIKVDMPAIEKSIIITDMEKDRLSDEMRLVSKGKIASAQAVRDIKNFLVHRGVMTSGVSKSDLLAILDMQVNLSEMGVSTYLSPDCEKVIKIRQEAGKSSTSKLKAMAQHADPTDSRMRGTLQFHGAGSTGRWAGRGPQVHNLPRPTIAQPLIEQIFDTIHKLNPKEAIELIGAVYGNPLARISDCLRGFIIAEEGYDLIDGDWSAIEARVLCWLANEQRDLNVFKTHGRIYEATAARIYRVDISEVTEFQRFIGKMSVLSLGYQGGKNAFTTMSKNFGAEIEKQTAIETVRTWRADHEQIVGYWKQTEEAAFRAVQEPGVVQTCGPNDHRKIKYKTNGSFLFCRLPSGRKICYPYPKIELKTIIYEDDDGETRSFQKQVVTYKRVDPLSRKWVRAGAYGGLYTENITQAVARDLLAETLIRLEDKGYPVIMHVHDEILCEIPSGTKSKKEFAEIMCENPHWARGLPLEANVWRGKRYRK